MTLQNRESDIGRPDELSKRHGHCEDTPIGGDEAISSSNFRLTKITPLKEKWY
jgi:hypothetical protein